MRPQLFIGVYMKYWPAKEKARVKDTSEMKTLTSFLGMQDKIATESNAPGWFEATSNGPSKGIFSAPLTIGLSDRSGRIRRALPVIPEHLASLSARAAMRPKRLAGGLNKGPSNRRMAPVRDSPRA